MPMFRKRPVVIEARQLAGATSDVHGVYQWIESHTSGSFEPLAVLGGEAPAPKSGVSTDPGTGELLIATLEGVMRASIGDWIIRGVAGEFYPCRGDIFEATYEGVADDGRVDSMPEVRGDETP